MAGKTKPLMFCPWCDEGQARTWQGMTAHVRSKHPDKIQELKDNKAIYLEKFACDEFGNPVGGSPDPTPAPDPKPDPSPEPDPTPAPVVKPPKPDPTPAPDPKPKPAEGGGFRGSLGRIFRD
jgi:hypothetical protein